MVRKHISDVRVGAGRTKKQVKEYAEPKERRKMRVTDYRRLRECLRMQKASYIKSCINPTQFRRIVAELIRDKHEGFRISKRSLAPLMLMVETDMLNVLMAARYMSHAVGGKKSVGLRSLNLAEALILRPEVMNSGPPLSTTSFDDDTDGIAIDFTAPGTQAKLSEEKKKAKKSGAPSKKKAKKTEEKAEDGEADKEEPADDDKEEEEEESEDSE